MSSKRTYQQYCGLASALDVLGERWTLLVVRELLMGPRRYSELLAGLPGLGTNLLAERLKFLVGYGVVRQVDVSGTGSRLAYELTEQGEQLRPLVLGLARWGMQFMGDVEETDAVRPHWGFLAVESMLDQDKVGSLEESYEFRVDGEVFHIDVRDGRASAVRGPAVEPAMTAGTDATTFVRIGSGTVTPMMAMLMGKLELGGDMQAVLRCCTLLGLDVGGPVAAQSVPARRRVGA